MLTFLGSVRHCGPRRLHRIPRPARDGPLGIGRCWYVYPLGVTIALVLIAPVAQFFVFSGIDRAAAALSSSALLRIAEGQLASAKAEWEQMRNDPQYLVNVITQTAHNCVEALIPDRRTGEILDPEQLLKTPHFVSSKLRYSAHNLLLTVGDWSLIVNVLRDIEKLDEKVGRFGDREKRGFFMAQVRCSSTVLS